MKKLTAIFLCIILLVAYSGFGVFAATDDSRITAEEAFADGTLSVVLGSASASAHSEVSLNLSLNSNPGFSVMILTLDYGSENITMKSVDCDVDGVTAEFSNQSGKATLAFYHLGSDCTATGTLATLTFSVGAFSGNAEIVISAEDGDICNSEAEMLETNFTSGLIAVSCSHTYVYEGRTEPSCFKKGEIRYVCTVCQDVNITYIDKTDHVARGGMEVVTEPDCDTPGMEAQICMYCSQPIESTIKTSAALGHKFSGDPIVTKEANCTEDGSYYKDCYVCKHREVTAIPKLGHDEGTWRITHPSDCTQAGLASRYCNRCDAVLETEDKEIGEHFMAWAVTKAPTCTEEGLEEYLCLVCGSEKSDSRSIPVLEHTAGEEVIVREPTCSETGLADTRCKEEDCSHLISSREIAKVAHVKNSLTVVTAPTSQNAGAGEYHCKVCDELMESVVLPVTNGVFYIETTPALPGKATTVNVYVRDNPGFSVGIVRIRYDVASMIYGGVTAGEITDDLTEGVPEAGEIAVLISLENAQYTENGLIFSLNFTLTGDATNGEIELFYNPQNDFSAENGDRVFFNMESGEITILSYVRGDCDGDGEINSSDLATLKLFLAGAMGTISEGADVDENGGIDTGDLAALKLHLAGVSQFE